MHVKDVRSTVKCLFVLSPIQSTFGRFLHSLKFLHEVIGIGSLKSKSCVWRREIVNSRWKVTSSVLWLFSVYEFFMAHKETCSWALNGLRPTSVAYKCFSQRKQVLVPVAETCTNSLDLGMMVWSRLGGNDRRCTQFEIEIDSEIETVIW